MFAKLPEIQQLHTTSFLTHCLFSYLHHIFIRSYLPPSLSIRLFSLFAPSPFHSSRVALQDRCSLVATDAEGVYVCMSVCVCVCDSGSACSPWCSLLDNLEFDCFWSAVLTDLNKDMVDFYAKIRTNHRPRSAMPLSLNTQVRPQPIKTGFLGTEMLFVVTLMCKKQWIGFTVQYVTHSVYIWVMCIKIIR